MELMEQLRAATRDAHDRIERLPAAQAMARGDIDRPAYAAVLARLYWVHAVFEGEADRHPELAAVWPREAVRAEAVLRDLRALGATPLSAPPPAVLAWADRVRAAGSAAAWAGVGYVLEGSRMGGRVLVGPVARGLGVPVGPGVGLDYHLEGVADLGPRFGRVRAALAALDTSPAARDALVFGAVAGFDVMAAVHSAPAVPDPVPAPAGAV